MYQVYQPTDELFLNDANASQTVRSCLNSYLKWLERNRSHWTRPQISAYQDYLTRVRGLSRQSVAVYTSIIRTRYREIAKDRALVGALFTDVDATEREWLVDEQVKRFGQAFEDKHNEPVITRASVPRPEHGFLLNHDSLSSLVDQFDLKTAIGLRDAALISLMLATGLRDTEIITLTVEDLKHCISSRSVLRIRPGRAVRARPVFYGDLENVVDIVQRWLDAAGITEGLVFRGFYRRELRVREKLTPRALQSIFNAYPVISGNQMRSITPLDLRRAYAFHLLESGADLYTVQVQLGIHDKGAVEQLVSNYGRSEPLRLPEIIERVRRNCL